MMKKQKQNGIFKIKKGEKAITLIALVVSIVVILLLAGVTIATLTGDNRHSISSTKCTGEKPNSKI